jgi:hypothetical protein
MKMVDEEIAKAEVLLYDNVVVITEKEGCPVCEYFIPDVLVPLFNEEFWTKNIHFMIIDRPFFFPHETYPKTYCFKKGKLVHTSKGAASREQVKTLIEEVYHDVGDVPSRVTAAAQGRHPFR